MSNMVKDWKEYKVEPDKELFAKIERRILMRRTLRWSAIALCAIAIAGTAIWFVMDQQKVSNVQTIQTVEPEVAYQTTLPVVEPPAEPARTKETVSTDATSRQPHNVEKHQDMDITIAHIEPVDNNWSLPLPKEAPSLDNSNVTQQSRNIDELILNAAEAPETVLPEPGHEEASPAKSSGTVHYENVFTAPNIIIPSSEEEGVRQFKLYSSSNVDNFRLAIFNRGGREVFSTNDINQAWDGTHNGNLVAQGAYVWMATFRDSDGNLRQERGSVTVVR